LNPVGALFRDAGRPGMMRCILKAAFPLLEWRRPWVIDGYVALVLIF
jgi:hypothetical protein